MKKITLLHRVAACCACALIVSSSFGQVGRRFPAEKKIINDPVTGTELTFLTSAPAGDSKIYQTHPDWTSDGQWVIFRSNRAPGQAMAVNERTGDIVQVTEKGYMGMLCVARKSMNLYIMRDTSAAGRRRGGAPGDPGVPDVIGAPAYGAAPETAPTDNAGGAAAPGQAGARKGGFFRSRGPFQIVEVHLGKIFADSAAGTMGPADSYERVCGTMPTGMGASGNMGLDANEDYVYFSVSGGDVGQGMDLNNPVYKEYEEPGTNHAKPFGPRGMGGGPSGLRAMNLKTGEVTKVVDVPFQIGHVQTNPWMPGEIIFCWETGGKAPQRTWMVNRDGSGLRKLWPEASFDWVTHEAVITKDEVAIAILAHRMPGLPANDPWGPQSSTGEHPSGVGIVNLRTHQMRIIGQVPMGNPGRSIWHVNGSADGRWAAADDFQYRLWIIDRHTGEMMMLADMGHVTRASDHIHPTFSADGTKIEIQSAMLSAMNPDLHLAAPPARGAAGARAGARAGGRGAGGGLRTTYPLNICVVPLPRSWLARNYGEHAEE